jgi:hypothetical protein
MTAIGCIAGKKATEASQTIVWKLEKVGKVGEYEPVVLGNPRSVTASTGTYLSFNGLHDGLIVPKIPIEGWQQFTIEVLFKPDNDGPTDPRFIHFEDTALNRGTFELRITADGQWYMDTFLKNGKTDSRLTLIDSTKLHPAKQWTWAALVYDGKTMSSYVNGKKELEGSVDLPAFVSGNLSIGVRLNRINWFKGAIKEIRFHPQALAAKKMQTGSN